MQSPAWDVQPHGRARRARAHAALRRSHRGRRSRRHRHRGGAQARGLMPAVAATRARLTLRLAPVRRLWRACRYPLLVVALSRLVFVLLLRWRAGSRARTAPASGSSRCCAPGRLGRHLVPLDRRPRLRPDDRPRRQRRLPPALPAAPARAARAAAVRRPGLARGGALDRAHGGRHVPALQAHRRALRAHDRAADGALPVDLAARVRLLGGLRREPLPGARHGRVPARRAAALRRRARARRARRARAAGRPRARARR